MGHKSRTILQSTRGYGMLLIVNSKVKKKNGITLKVEFNSVIIHCIIVKLIYLDVKKPFCCA